MVTEDLTGVLRTFWHFKNKHPDTVLLFRVGDLYVSLAEDARILHETAGLNLTTQTVGGQDLKLAGAPAEYVDRYLVRLIGAGYRVAKCEPVDRTGARAEGPIERNVRVVRELDVPGGL